MTPVEQPHLPQLSLQRYVDLVKRRRWQVLPVSLLGLLVGGIVAFFIPRYYVAETTLWHQSVGQEPGVEDPMHSIVASATETIPLVARKVVSDKLKWPELVGLDDHDLEQFAKSVRSRITVFDRNAGERRRDFALIQVAYRDRNGKRAADFLNAAVKTWIETRIEDLRAPVERDRRRASEDVGRWSSTYEQLLEDRRDLEQQYKIEPAVDLGAQRSELAKRQEGLEKLAAELRAKESALAGLTRTLAQERENLAALPPRVAPSLGSMAEAARKTPEGIQALVEVTYLEQAAANYNTRHRLYRITKSQLDAANQRLMAIVAPKQESPDGLIDNPLYAPQKKIVDEIDAKHAALLQDVVALRATTGGLSLEERIAGFTEYEKKQAKLDEAKLSRDQALAARLRAEGLLARLASEAPVYQLFEAAPPPRPTEPNILVVALVGCLLGLGAAIGLILLLDMLQGSFKTIDDVERGLGVPVLGGVSHLETVSERQSAQRTRTRASILAFTFVGLVVAVGLIFYFYPTRLPPVVRDLLALVLGGG